MKILLADPNPDVQAALRLVLERKSGVQVSGETGDLWQLFACCAQQCSDLILLDAALVGAYSSRSRGSPSLAGTLQVLRRLCPHARVMVMSSRFEAEQEARDAGADGFLSKTAPPGMIWDSISRIFQQGQGYRPEDNH